MFSGLRFLQIVAVLAIPQSGQGKTPTDSSSKFSCIIVEKGSFGVFTANVTATAADHPSGYIRWDSGDGQFQNPWVTGAWFLDESGRFDSERGYVSIMRHIWARKPNKKIRVQNLKLEVSTSLKGFPHHASRIASQVQKSAGPFHIFADWNDVVALAAGAQHLWLLAKDRKGNLVDTVELDRSVLQKASLQLPQVIERLNSMIEDPQANCIPYMGNDDGEIIVTSFGGGTSSHQTQH